MPEHQAKTKHPSAGFSSRRMLYIMLSIAILIAVFLIVAYPMIIPGAPTSATIKIPKNANIESVSDSLEKYFGTKYSSSVVHLIKMRRTDLSKRHGAYHIAEGTNALNAMRQLTSGGQTPVNVTINGFRSLPLMLDKLSSKFEFPADSLYALVMNPTMMAKYNLTPDNAMALFLDDSYQLYWTSSPEQVIAKIGQNYLYVWDETRRNKAANLNLTPAQVMILASIVDEETNASIEKGTIGRLYINRLEKGMKLQADPTVKFAKKDFSIRRISREDLQFQSAYNTYLHKGLPPGPIRTTSIATIDAILNSEPNDYLYMCAKEELNGTHNFARSYEEHTQNALRYQHALDQRGIKR